MITEQELEKQQIEKIENGIRICEEAIAKAEKYERLSDNTDWKGYLQDLDIRCKMHDKEIQLAISVMDEAPNNGYLGSDGKHVSSKLDWIDFIRNHKIRSDMYREWIKEPETITKFAEDARKMIPILNKQLNTFKKEPVGASGNGAS